MSAFRVGQDVVCIRDCWKVLDGHPPGLRAPKRGEQYKIRSIADYGEGLGLRLCEIVNPEWEYAGGLQEAIFLIRSSDGTVNFRPVVATKTDISSLVALLTPAAIAAAKKNPELVDI